ncbi:hypothetical protein [Corynebacterium lubricantis]|uniref:hypothetical protein n=1 Tax=Corynebacterium lubricantis TaxID=541095 RepID=UPI0003698C61|nr:hypothetical protein [Corynebacterium lubricantis]
MASLSISDDRLTVTLDWWEKIVARRSHLTIPLRSITSVTCVENTRAALGRGKRTSATNIPRLTYAGTMNRDIDDRVLAICHRHSAGIMIELKDATYSAIFLSTPNAKEYAAKLESLTSH